MKIIVIDDDISILGMLSAYFKEKGIDGIFLSDPSLAESQIKEHKPDCVLIDLKMGPPTGKEIIVHLRAEGIKVPIIVMSAFVTYALESEIKKLGIRKFLYKPFDLKEMDKMIASATRKSTSVHT
ncbi:MAG: response regulator [Candidatus Aureabacteria bacterium]|nr:response regulator [Candidatus Auribacterota bacterium]